MSTTVGSALPQTPPPSSSPSSSPGETEAFSWGWGTLLGCLTQTQWSLKPHIASLFPDTGSLCPPEIPALPAFSEHTQDAQYDACIHLTFFFFFFKDQLRRRTQTLIRNSLVELVLKSQ